MASDSPLIHRSAMMARLQASLTELAKLSPDHVCMRAELGVHNFGEFLDTLRDVRRAAEGFQKLRFSQLPTPSESELKTLASIEGCVSMMQQFDPHSEGQKLGERYDALLKNLRANLKPAAERLTYLYLIWHAMGVDQTDWHERMGTITGLLEDARHVKKEIDGVLAAAREAGEQVGVERHARLFSQAAENHAWFAGLWVVVTVAAAGFAIGVSFWFAEQAFTPVVAQSTVAQSQPSDPAPYLISESVHSVGAVQWIASRIVIMAILYSAVFWAVRNHRAHRHLCVVNQHRQNALSTFQTFVEGAFDDETKNAVLLEATRCIFSASVTGYLGGQEETPDTPLVEVMRTIRKTNHPS